MLYSNIIGRNMARHLMIFVGAIAASSSQASPYKPSNGAQVIEQLPSRNDPLQKEFNRLRAALSVAPNNVILAAQFSRRAIDTARNDGDPRYLGYAQAALTPWWNLPEPPVEVRLLRATLLQSTHQFPSALNDLQSVIKSDPRNAQAWLTRASIYAVQGNYESAKQDCMHLYSLAPELIAVTCIANVAGITGQAAKSYALLEKSFKQNVDSEPELKMWVMTLLAETAARLGDNKLAEEHFKHALDLRKKDSYLLGAYADFLLDQDRADEVMHLLKEKTRVDGLLLRYTLALQMKKMPDTAKNIAELDARFQAAMMRGDTVHQREQARFELQLKNNPHAALRLAQSNWAVQKEAADARIYLESASVLHDNVAAQPVLSWLQKNGTEDVMLTKLTNSFRRGAV